MSRADMLSPIAEFCRDRGIPWDTSRAETMGHYLDLLLQFNESMNLIGPLEAEQVVEELLLDSVVAAAARRPRGPILDVGAGAGLPGIPLKIVFDELPLVLVEPRRKRSTFLKLASHRLGLSEVTVFRGRIEEFEGRHFDMVISKAFQPPLIWLETAQAFVDSDGVVICMARESDRQRLSRRASELGLEMVGEADGAGRGAEKRVCYALTPF